MIRKFAVAIACTSATFLGIVATPAQAALFNLGDLIDSNGSFTVGDKQFSGFACGIAKGGAFSTPFSCDEINVVTLEDDPVGISFQSGFFAGPNSFIDTVLEYTVTVLDPNKSISDITMAFNGSFTGKNGFTNVTETVFNSANEIIGQLTVTNPPTDLQDPVYEIDQDIPLAYAVKQAKVKKDIFVGAGANSTAAITFIDQRFKQTSVPEPGAVSSLLLFGLGGVGLMLKRQRQESAKLKLFSVANNND